MGSLSNMQYIGEENLALADITALNGLAKDLSDLFNNVRHGHLGRALYSNGGSERFAKVTQTKSYVPFKGEAGIIQAHKEEIAHWAGNIENVIIVGPGPAMSLEAKESEILKLMSPKTISILDISPEFLKAAQAKIKEIFPHVIVKAYEVDFLHHKPDPSTQPALVISTGSLTNFENAPYENFPGRQLNESLSAFKNLAGPNGKVLWGYNSALNDEGYDSQEVANFILYPLEKAALRQGIFINPENFSYARKLYPQAAHLAHQWVANAYERVQIGDEMINISRGDRFTAYSSICPDPTKVSKLSKEQNMITGPIFREAGGAVLHAFNCK